MVAETYLPAVCAEAGRVTGGGTCGDSDGARHPVERREDREHEPKASNSAEVNSEGAFGPLGDPAVLI
eukprot:9432007-Alexandrium_andersonii.AAC.1